MSPRSREPKSAGLYSGGTERDFFLVGDGGLRTSGFGSNDRGTGGGASETGSGASGDGFANFDGSFLLANDVNLGGFLLVGDSDDIDGDFMGDLMARNLWIACFNALGNFRAGGGDGSEPGGELNLNSVERVRRFDLTMSDRRARGGATGDLLDVETRCSGASAVRSYAHLATWGPGVLFEEDLVGHIAEFGLERSEVVDPSVAFGLVGRLEVQRAVLGHLGPRHRQSLLDGCDYAGFAHTTEK